MCTKHVVPEMSYGWRLYLWLSQVSKRDIHELKELFSVLDVDGDNALTQADLSSFPGIPGA